MSLAHEIFSLPQPEQDAAIRYLARKAINKATAFNKSARSIFGRFVMPLIRAKHAAGMPKEELAALRKHYRVLYQQEKLGMQNGI